MIAMVNNQRRCINCKIPMKRVFITYKNLELESRECPECKEKIFTEDLAMKAAIKLELMDKLLSKSTLTEEDVLELGRKVNRVVAKRHGLLT